MNRRNRMVFVLIVGSLFFISGVAPIAAGASTARAGWPIAVAGAILIVLQLVEAIRRT